MATPPVAIKAAPAPSSPVSAESTMAGGGDAPLSPSTRSEVTLSGGKPRQTVEAAKIMSDGMWMELIYNAVCELESAGVDGFTAIDVYKKIYS